VCVYVYVCVCVLWLTMTIVNNRSRRADKGCLPLWDLGVWIATLPLNWEDSVELHTRCSKNVRTHSQDVRSLFTHNTDWSQLHQADRNRWCYENVSETDCNVEGGRNWLRIVMNGALVISDVEPPG